MRAYLDCYPCFLRQALTASRMAGATDDVEWQVLEALDELAPVRDAVALS